MGFSQWLEANGYDESKLSPAQRTHLEAAWKADGHGGNVEDTIRGAESKAELISTLRRMTEEAVKPHADAGEVEKIRQLQSLFEEARKDATMTVEKYSLALMRLDRALPVIMAQSSTGARPNSEILEAAFCAMARLPDIQKHFSPHVLDAAHRQFKHGLSPRELLMIAAEQNGYKGSHRDLRAVLKAAFRDAGDGASHNMYAGVYGPSYINASVIFANTANKFLRASFEAVDSAWSQISARRVFNDYKQVTSLSLTGDLMYKELPPVGEIKHGTLGETTYTNQANIYALMLGIDERDLRNDDLGAFNRLATLLGRGGALKINDVFWTAFLNNSTFFAAGNNNVITGASSVLSGATGIGALTLAMEKFMLQTDPDGKPLGARPAILLVPTALEAYAKNLMNSTITIGTTTANSPMPANNPWAGMFRIVSSPYLQNSSYTGYSATAWYLLADPNDIPVVEIGFLDGVDTPMVETADADFQHLGIMMRGSIKFGVALQEYRGGVRAAGA